MVLRLIDNKREKRKHLRQIYIICQIIIIYYILYSLYIRAACVIIT